MIAKDLQIKCKSQLKTLRMLKDTYFPDNKILHIPMNG